MAFCGKVFGELEFKILGSHPKPNTGLYCNSDFLVHSFESDCLCQSIFLESGMYNFDFRTTG